MRPASMELISASRDEPPSSTREPVVRLCSPLTFSLVSSFDLTLFLSLSVIIMPAADAAAVHAAIPGAASDGAGGFTLPCTTTASLAFTFGGQSFAIVSRRLSPALPPPSSLTILSSFHSKQDPRVSSLSVFTSLPTLRIDPLLRSIAPSRISPSCPSTRTTLRVPACRASRRDRVSRPPFPHPFSLLLLPPPPLAPFLSR